jgi:hypothetical protein
MWAINYTPTIETKGNKTYLDPPSTIKDGILGNF